MAREIIETIVTRHLQPGDALPPERELGEQFGVSRTVIREAVRALDARGLLEVRVGSRIKVAAVDRETVRDAIWHFARTTPVDESSVETIGLALEAAAARLAAEHATREELDMIEDSAARLESAQDPAEAELAFRRAVMAAGHNELLGVLAEAISGLRSPRPLSPRTYSRHLAVVRAIAGRDGDGAERAMREMLGRPADPDTGRD